jgi:hypothetical protein
MIMDMEMLRSGARKVFRLVGRNKFVLRLYDFLAHGGRSSRTETLKDTTKALLDLEQATKCRVETIKTIIELMQAAGFTEDEVKEYLQKNDELLDVSKALETLLAYTENGSISIRTVNTTREDVSLSDISGLKNPRVIPAPDDPNPSHER